jgi:ribosomal protein L37AE/L43A
MGKKKKMLRICPKCKKPSLRRATNVSGWLAPEQYKCTKCNYVGALYLEVEKEDYEKFLEEQKNKERSEEDPKD